MTRDVPYPTTIHIANINDRDAFLDLLLIFKPLINMKVYLITRIIACLIN